MTQTELRWITNLPPAMLAYAEAMTASAAMRHGASPAMLEALRLVRAEVSDAGLDERQFWQQAVPLSVSIGDYRQLAEVILRKLPPPHRSPSRVVDALARAIAALRHAAQKDVAAALDAAGDETDALKRQWDEWGSAVLSALAALADEGLVPASASVLVVPQLLDGGRVYPLYNSLSFAPGEALPGRLAAVLRLAWMLGQLNMELPRYGEHLSAARREEVAALALFPAIIQAAGEAGFYSRQAAVGCPPEGIDCRFHHLAAGEGLDGPTIDCVWQWWQTYIESRPAWPVALAALDRMLDGAMLCQAQ